MVLLFAGCSGGAAEEAAVLAPGTQGQSTVKATRGVVSDEKLFVSMDKQIDVECVIGWEVLGEETTERQVVLMLETFRMYLQDALDGLTTEEASSGDLDAFLNETIEKTLENLQNEQISITVDEASAKRVENP